MINNLKIVLEGKGPLTLSANDHIATGGEGSIFKKAGTVMKIFTDPEKMKRDGMAEKLRLLMGFKHPHIIAPQGLILGEDGKKQMGYYMPFVAGEPLSRVFTSDFRQREGITDKHAVLLTENMRAVVQFAHDRHAVLVDANELNWQVKIGKSLEPRILDVDSWAIGRWPAKVIMPSIRDWHSSVFDQKTDWFSWGIVTFQVFTGIHPFKGTLDGYKLIDLEQRMKDNASVFTPGIRLNRAVRDFSCIPDKLRDWYRATFQEGERSLPPSPLDTGASVGKAAVIARVIITATGQLIYDKLLSSQRDPAIRIFHCGVALLESGILVDLSTKRKIGRVTSKDCEVVKVEKGWLKAEKQVNGFSFTYIDEVQLSEVPLTLQTIGQSMLRYENRLFLVTDQGLNELNLRMFGKPIVSAGSTWGVMVNSTRWYDGVGIQDAMGAMFIIAPFGERACSQIRVRELDGLRPINAKAGNRFVVVVALDRKGNYQKIELAFDAEYKTYKVSQVAASGPELNMAILPKGVTASIVEDGELNIINPTNGRKVDVKDKAVSTEMALANWDDVVVYILDGNVWKVSMRK